MSQKNQTARRAGDCSGGTRPELIVEVAKRLWAERGFAATSIDEIGAAAGITGPAIYRHFAGKHAVLAAALHEHMARVEARLALQGDSPLQTLEWLIEGHITDCVNEPEMMLVYLNESAHLPEPERGQHRRVRRDVLAQYTRLYAELKPELPPGQARLAVSAATATMNASLHIRQALSKQVLKEGLKMLTLRVLGLPASDWLTLWQPQTASRARAAGKGPQPHPSRSPS